MEENHDNPEPPLGNALNGPQAKEGSKSATHADDPTRTAQGQLAANERIGHYRLLEQIGTGGMGEVYRAEQTDPIRRTVALKIIKRGMDTAEVITRFEAERQALALMDHPNIAKVFDAGSTPQGRPFFVMEYVPGIPITTFADRHQLSVRQRIELFVHLCEGVQHAHQKAIIHRDLKPSNVLVATWDDQPVPKIIDFGVAKATAQRLTEKTMYTALGALIGTPEYMSPEQAEMTGEDIDTRTDVYSLGIILYELLSGALPFDPADLQKAGFEGILRTIREKDPPRPSTRLAASGEKAHLIARVRCSEPKKLRSQLQGDLDWITMKALAKDRSLRYGSAAEFAADLQRHLAHEPVIAGPPSIKYRLGKFVRRHRAAVSFAAVLIALLAGFAATMAVQAQHIARERDRANAEAQRANQEAERASQEAQATKDVTDFLVGLFDASDPRVALGDTMTAREVVDFGANSIDSLTQAPLQKARLLETLGRVYQNLGAYDRAGELLEKAVLIRRHEQSDNHPDLGRTLRQLGWLRGAYQRNCQDARKPLFESLAIMENQYGPNDLETARSLYCLGSALSFCQDRETCALEYLERARTIFEDTLGATSLQVSWCWNDLGNLHWDYGEYSRALECYQRAVDIKRQHLPPNHPDLTTSLGALAGMLLKLGRCEEAQPIVEQALEFKIRTLGWENDHTASGLIERGSVYRCLGSFAEAREDVMRALKVLQKSPNHDYEIYARWQLSRIEMETGHFTRADDLFKETVTLIERTHGSDSLIMAEILEERAKELRDLGRQTEAAALEDQVRNIRVRQPCRHTGT